jgi:competence protein ComEA
MIRIPRKGEILVADSGPSADSGVSSGKGMARPGKSKITAGHININRASIEELESLPGVGPATAAKIEDYRKEHGRFQSIEDLTAIPGIGEKKLAKMRKFLTL